MIPAKALSQALANNHPQSELLCEIATSETGLTAKGFAYLCEDSWNLFRDRVPHLFRDGHSILSWCETVRAAQSSLVDWSPDRLESLERALKVMETVVFTTAITAPSDLWLLRQVIACHSRLPTFPALATELGLNPDTFAESHQLNRRQLKIDLHFLVSRGYATWDGSFFRPSPDPQAASCLMAIKAHETWQIDWISEWTALFSAQQPLTEFHREWLALPEPQSTRAKPGWIALPYEIELGYRLVPLVLALRVLELTPALKAGVLLSAILSPPLAAVVAPIFEAAGLLDQGIVNKLGERLFERGPGPFGIIAAYHPYLNGLDSILRNAQTKVWVRRAANVAASQEANRRTFEQAHDALDRFCKDTGFQYQIFIEHAVGKGEATRQRFLRDQGLPRHYFGADLEDAAIDEAIAERDRGLLPANMRFIRNADVGIPARIVDALREAGLNTEGAVMVVGNGFHEIREQSNQKLLDVFRGYQEAGILLIFTEETGLSDQDLLETAWNTYHAGFRHVHEMSGQGLRPSWDGEQLKLVWSWRRCAQEAGYLVMKRYTSGTRSIFPTRRPERRNPSISVTYFCVPRSISGRLGLEPG